MFAEIAKLYEQANRAAADAARYDRQPNGEGLASMRRRDARTLRAWARERLTEAGEEGLILTRPVG